MSRSYTNRARPAQATRPTQRMNPARGMSDELPMEGESDGSPTRREPVRGTGYTVIAPDENKRQAIQRQADEEKRNYEEYKNANRPHFSYVATVGTSNVNGATGDSDSSAGTRGVDVTQRKLPPTGSNLTPMQKAQMYREQEKLRKEKEAEEHKQKQRQKSDENEKREAQRMKQLEADHKKRNNAWLDKLEGKPSENKVEKPAASSASAATGGNTEESDGAFVDALGQLENMFPWVEKDILKSLLKEAGNDVDHVAQLLS